jgi:hypothetical protein
MSSIRHLLRSSSLQWQTLLLACVLVCAQTLALEHIHAADTPAEACVICVHGDTPAALANTLAPAAAPAAAYDFISSHATGTVIASPVGYLTRAPPQA